jgi:hypothetical protein
VIEIEIEIVSEIVSVIVTVIGIYRMKSENWNPHLNRNLVQDDSLYLVANSVTSIPYIWSSIGYFGSGYGLISHPIALNHTDYLIWLMVW